MAFRNAVDQDDAAWIASASKANLTRAPEGHSLRDVVLRGEANGHRANHGDQWDAYVAGDTASWSTIGMPRSTGTTTILRTC